MVLEITVFKPKAKIKKDKIKYANNNISKSKIDYKYYGFIIISNKPNSITNPKKISLNKTYILLKDDKFPLYSEIISKCKGNHDTIVDNKLSDFFRDNLNINFNDLRNIQKEQIYSKNNLYLYLVYVPYNDNNNNKLKLFNQEKLQINISHEQYTKTYCWKTYIDFFKEKYNILYHNILIFEMNNHLKNRIYPMIEPNNVFRDKILNISLNLIYIKLINLFL